MSPSAEADELEAIMRLVATDPREAARRFNAIPVIVTYQALAVAVSMVLENALAGRIEFTAVIPGEQPAGEKPVNRN